MQEKRKAATELSQPPPKRQRTDDHSENEDAYHADSSETESEVYDIEESESDNEVDIRDRLSDQLSHLANQSWNLEDNTHNTPVSGDEDHEVIDLVSTSDDEETMPYVVAIQNALMEEVEEYLFMEDDDEEFYIEEVPNQDDSDKEVELDYVPFDEYNAGDTTASFEESSDDEEM